MIRPRISVIMPVFNAEKYIEEAVKSICNQTLGNFELIVVDDCGNDSSMEIISAIKDDRIKILHNSENKGIAYSRNRALEACTGEYIAIMDDDDISLPYRLQCQADFLDYNTFIDIVGGQSSIINGQGEVIQGPEMMQEDYKMNKVMFLFYNSFHNSEVMFRRELVMKNNIRYVDHMLGMEDFRFWIDCACHGKISNVNEEILKYRITDANETARVRSAQGNDRKELFGLLRKYSLEKNGFYVSDRQMKALNLVVNEEGTGKFECAQQVMELFTCMQSLVKQSHEMEKEYIEELKMWLKIIFTNKVSGSSHTVIWM